MGRQVCEQIYTTDNGPWAITSWEGGPWPSRPYARSAPVHTCLSQADSYVHMYMYPYHVHLYLSQVELCAHVHVPLSCTPVFQSSRAVCTIVHVHVLDGLHMC